MEPPPSRKLYRLVSLTSVPCKILKPIIFSPVRDHLGEYNVLTLVEHEFRGGHSCESQLLVTLQDLMCWRDRKVQVDVAILDFANAFDTVAHETLLGKLDHYRVNGNLNTWIRAFYHTEPKGWCLMGNCPSLWPWILECLKALSWGRCYFCCISMTYL